MYESRLSSPTEVAAAVVAVALAGNAAMARLFGAKELRTLLLKIIPAEDEEEAAVVAVLFCAMGFVVCTTSGSLALR